MNIREEIGAQLRIIRIRKGLSTRQVAEKAGINHSHIAKIERGTYNLRIDTLYKIAAALNTRLSLLNAGFPHVVKTSDDFWTQGTMLWMLKVDEPTEGICALDTRNGIIFGHVAEHNDAYIIRKNNKDSIIPKEDVFGIFEVREV